MSAVFRLTDSQGALYKVNGAINIITDIAILAFPVWIVWGLQMQLRYKRAVVVIFWIRIVYASQLFHRTRLLQSS